MVAPHYNYADTVWSGCGIANENRLQVTQNFAVRSILGRSKHSSATEALRTLNFLPLSDKRKVHEAVYVHKAMNGRQPKEITDQYNSYKPKQNPRTCKLATLNIPKHATEQYKKSPMYRTIKTWNNIPEQLRSETTTATFKKKYQTHLINRKP